MHHKF